MAATQDMIKADAEPVDPAVLERVILSNDISGLNPKQKVAYASALAVRVGLDPATAPFKVIKKKGGGEGLYADKGTTEQLRQKHKISVKIVGREVVESSFVVTAQGRVPDGREDESIGAVPIANLRGEDHSNALMKAETKAKRRVTLSLLGLGAITDEIEINNSWANVPQENQKQADVVQLPPAQVTTKQAAPKAETKKQGAKLKKWTVDQPLPDCITKGLPPLGLDGIPLTKMAEEDLEAVIEHGGKAYGDWSKMPSVVPKLLALLQEIVLQASIQLKARRGDVAPPPVDDEGNGVGEPFDGNEDGEVRS